MTKPTTENTLSVTDVHRAAVLLTLKVPLVDCVPSKSGTRMTFVFSDEGDQARLAGAAIAQNRLIPVGDFLDNLRKAREFVYQFNVTHRNSNPRKDDLL